jgi:hypothetical protein
VSRPSRLFIVLTVVIIAGLGVAAYLVNFPIVWIAVVGALVMVGLVWRISRPKHAQLSTPNAPTDSNVSPRKPESALGA